VLLLVYVHAAVDRRIKWGLYVVARITNGGGSIIIVFVDVIIITGLWSWADGHDRYGTWYYVQRDRTYRRNAHGFRPGNSVLKRTCSGERIRSSTRDCGHRDGSPDRGNAITACPGRFSAARSAFPASEPCTRVTRTETVRVMVGYRDEHDSRPNHGTCVSRARRRVFRRGGGKHGARFVKNRAVTSGSIAVISR